MLEFHSDPFKSPIDAISEDSKAHNGLWSVNAIKGFP